MRSIALDTYAYVAFKRGEDGIVTVVQRCPDLLLCATVLGELLAGFAAGTREAKNRQELSLFMQSPRVRQVACGSVTADNYGLIYAASGRKGKPIPSNDVWIAASALENGAGLLLPRPYEL